MKDRYRNVPPYEQWEDMIHIAKCVTVNLGLYSEGEEFTAVTRISAEKHSYWVVLIKDEGNLIIPCFSVPVFVIETILGFAPSQERDAAYNIDLSRFGDHRFWCECTSREDLLYLMRYRPSIWGDLT
jgi:hypothetical protein